MSPPAPTVRAQAVVFEGDRLLCARHEKRGESYWVLPGGHLDPGETVWEALVREMAEETGLVVEAARLWALGEFAAPDRHVVECVFAVTAWTGEPARGHDPEAEEHPATLADVAWLDRERFAAVRFRPGILARRLLDRWGDPHAPPAYLGVERA
ncbi:MAG: NUDIX domain-containing protein [Gemmatimonadota bacterium]|nr:NUDIX domain-containing protein [Gemmatimonadota bacterium]